MKVALDKAGFEPKNDNHLLVVCGDCLDRGNESQQVIDYLMSVLNKVLIKGNHCTMFQELVERGYSRSHDWHNGTAKSVLDLAPESNTWDGACVVAMEKFELLLNQMVDYFETEHYIFVHSWIPCKQKKEGRPKFEYIPDWRTAHSDDWEYARWGSPLDMAMNGLNKSGKTIIAGHWHCSYGWALENQTFDEFGSNACFDPYYYDDKLIMIDTCCAYTNKINCLVIEDEEISDKEKEDANNDGNN